MKTPKSKLLALLVLFIFVACAGTKKVTKVKETLQVKSNTEVSKTSDEKTDLTTSVNTEKKAEESVKKNTSAEENESEETTIHTILYDPRLYTDSFPDRSLKVSETIKHTTKGKNKKSSGTEETMYNASEVNQVVQAYTKLITQRNDSLSKVNASLKSEVAEKTTKADNWWKWFLGGILSTVLAWAIIQFKWYKVLSFLWRKKL